MKVIAKHWVNFNGVWHKAGEEYEVPDDEQLEGVTEVKTEDTADSVFESELFPPIEQPKRRGRPKKTED